MEPTKCPACGGEMTMKCEAGEGHEHAETCHMECGSCGHKVNAPAAAEGGESSEGAAM